MTSWLRYDFGYSWLLTYGHLLVFAIAAAVAAWLWRRRRARWVAVVATLVAAWGLAGALIVLWALEINSPLTLPTARFLPEGGRVVDLGAGSGRATLMVLRSRPKAVVTALDLYDGYYGIADNTPARLRANAHIAGADGRVDVRVGDMRHLPFGDGVFDGAVSAFAIDHLRREGVTGALAEVNRVLRPGGHFLLMIINVDGWVRLALPTLHGHGYFGRAQDRVRWRASITGAGLEMIEEGTRPGTLYFLARRGQ